MEERDKGLFRGCGLVEHARSLHTSLMLKLVLCVLSVHIKPSGLGEKIEFCVSRGSYRVGVEEQGCLWDLGMLMICMLVWMLKFPLC